MDATGLSSATPSSRAFESAAATLTRDDVERFGRQMLVEEMGAAHVEEIRRGRVVCIGAGGLGSTVLLYLAGAGVGHLTIVDFDEVELSNLHRQVIHQMASIGQPKAESAKAACLRLFPAANVEALTTALTPANAERIFRDCDVVVDGTDNVAARYLINDAAMRCRKPLVSGSAIGWDGQLSVYGYRDGPCYRCLFPLPPPKEAVGSCNDSGVMGPLPGMIGCLQALETLKVLTGVGEALNGRLFVFNGLRFTSRVVQLRGKQPQCTACSPSALAETTLLTELAASRRPEYVGAGCAAVPGPLSPSTSCTVEDFAAQRRAAASATLTLDVRAGVQYDMAHLPHSICVPYERLLQWERAGTLLAQLDELLHDAVKTTGTTDNTEASRTAPVPVFVVCRRGINSVKAVKLIERALDSVDEHQDTQHVASLMHTFVFKNVEGGLNAYHRKVDREFPFY
ncbi:putative molybdopterin synthase sulfurylase-like protein [Leptomonas pyrrhocoris]|uniref:Adenylyltransferase and sulfurtransferase MOCS3 homolog n=1 Tax=Leptomonas pyrrhocoris TaxID=157538 RepID=A0A0M9G2P8_LEPPY|nr:putative molybdopterin synthase sulfurylase-like protein [Leptomonas pyrrhocoris]XP_015659462.1 putative molybdopterin synthase sulfurylase-like protein [Leptomonas pyrrhocoris]KPA81022.1 putative molybdopterin synthase sulfurylase-like protein [Leptomonas pyrrhocoris]KPA81023.1 putative molybdopterin synthase sulfurylase-like protein [Leptomonas pyrrhocoris]|eukprot:XP_015659461.1 putative molybdopterin synthase sulfurylase-like protein [Leptomonas pyrrhocoris]